ncbi:MAG: amidase [Acidimicrobiia bacterium]|nr:amidase [Acidimicrobiia bacterium]MXY74114.1 amidase [Acidimicrobiia bacterium]MYG91491.1 amidase [Acidimicrobiia bacterium]
MGTGGHGPALLVHADRWFSHYGSRRSTLDQPLSRRASCLLVGVGGPMESARFLARQVRAGKRSARDVIGQTLADLQDTQGALNLTTYINEAAMSRADDLDSRVAAGEDPGPLCGVPVVIKDLIDQAGAPTTCGSAFYRTYPRHSAPVVERLERAGAVIVARAGLHEFAFGFSSENQWFGPVRNPHDPTTSPGGSSGGSGAVVASGLAPISIGTDTGGSIRVPAALCGIFGLKVTHGRVPLTGVFPLGPSLDTVGPLAANSGDLAVAYSSMAGWHPEDPWSSPRPSDLDRLDAPIEPRELRVGLPEQWIANAPYAAGFKERFGSVISQLESLSVSIEEFSDPVLLPPGRINEILYPEVAAVHRAWWEEGKPYGAEVAGRIRETLEVGGPRPDETLLDAKRWQARLRHRMSAAFQRFHLLALPTSGALRKVIGHQEIQTATHGKLAYRAVLSWFTSLVNVSGCPAISIPVPRSDQSSGVPFSLQLVAPWWREDLLLRTAAILERQGVARSVLAVGTRPSHRSR